MKNGELKIYKFLGVIIKLQNGQDKKKEWRLISTLNF